MNNCLKDRTTILKKRASPCFLSKNQNHPLPLPIPIPPMESSRFPEKRGPVKITTRRRLTRFLHTYIYIKIARIRRNSRVREEELGSWKEWKVAAGGILRRGRDEFTPEVKGRGMGDCSNPAKYKEPAYPCTPTPSSPSASPFLQFPV